jgi:predicted nuclease of predicted toxin-antitoxin system
MQFLVDAQLPPALAEWLKSSGHVASHVYDYGMSGATDQLIWKKACDIDAFVVTKDADFFILAEQSDAVSECRAGVIWLRIGNTRTPRLLELMDNLLPQIGALAAQGQRFIEVGGLAGPAQRS